MAHRGGEGRWPSNTLFAFEQALKLGADWLEMDIQCSADGVLMVRHDPFVESTTDGSGFIRDLSLAELKKLDAGYTWTGDGGETFPFRGQGITIPTLEDVLQLSRMYRSTSTSSPKSRRSCTGSARCCTILAGWSR